MAGKKKAPEAVRKGPEKGEHLFSKERLLAAERFRERRDILEALLDAGKKYTVKAVEETIEKYMKGKVK